MITHLELLRRGPAHVFDAPCCGLSVPLPTPAWLLWHLSIDGKVGKDGPRPKHSAIGLGGGQESVLVELTGRINKTKGCIESTTHERHSPCAYGNMCSLWSSCRVRVGYRSNVWLDMHDCYLSFLFITPCVVSSKRRKAPSYTQHNRPSGKRQGNTTRTQAV